MQKRKPKTYVKRRTHVVSKLYPKLYPFFHKCKLTIVLDSRSKEKQRNIESQSKLDTKSRTSADIDQKHFLKKVFRYNY